jgi:lysyl-tRNA synthetase class II
MRTKPRQHKRTERIANLRKAGVGMTEIERPKTQNQKTRKQTNEKQSMRRESNPTDDPKF